MYRVAKAFAFTAEIGNQNDGFWPVPERVWPLCRSQVSPMIFLARAGGSFLATSMALYPDPTPRGNSFRVVVQIRNRGLAPTSRMYVKASVPWDLGPRGTFNLEAIGARNRTYLEL